MRLARRLAEPTPIMTAWSGIPSPDICGRLAMAGFDAVTLDMQHGTHTESSAFRAVADILAADKPAILRIPVGRNDLASRALDAGYEAVIAPMINSVADAKAFAAAMKYPPLGERSWGPGQALRLQTEHAAQSYFKAANGETFAIAMIETRAAAAVLDNILAIEGIDGVFLGPSDLSISWSGGAKVDPDLPEMQDFVAEVARKAAAAGKFAAVYAGDPARAPHYSKLGFRIIALANDDAVIRAGADAMLAKARAD